MLPRALHASTALPGNRILTTGGIFKVPGSGTLLLTAAGAELMTLTAQGKVTLHTQVYDLQDAVQAMHDLDNGKLVGRGILVPNHNK